MTPPGASLPYVDEHSVAIDVDQEKAWQALLLMVEGSFGGRPTGRFAELLGCADTAVSGPQPLARGSTVPGFHVEKTEAPRMLALAGMHRFSDYALIFRLEGVGGSTTVRAETRAAFPGLKGRVYRIMVIDTHIHVLMTRRLLRATKRLAEPT